MTQKSKTWKTEAPTKTAPPTGAELAAAIKRIRQAVGWSQEQMSREVRVASATLARFERGEQTPRAYRTLARLAEVAERQKMTEESVLFARAAAEVRAEGAVALAEQSKSRPSSPHEWRMLQIGRLSAHFFPEEARQIEKAAPIARALVDQVLAENAAAESWDEYAALEVRLNALAERRVLASFQKERK